MIVRMVVCSGRRKETRLFDSSRVTRKRTFPQSIEQDLGYERLGILAPGFAKIGIQLHKARQDRRRKAAREIRVGFPRDLEQESGVYITVRALGERKTERVRHFGERGILVQALLDVL